MAAEERRVSPKRRLHCTGAASIQGGRRVGVDVLKPAALGVQRSDRRWHAPCEGVNVVEFPLGG